MSVSLELARSSAIGAALLAATWLLLGTVISARSISFYSHLRQTISELAAHGTKRAHRISWLVFFPVGVLVWMFCFFFSFASGTSPAVAEAMWLYSLVGAGYVGAALFPCDFGAPLYGTWRNNIHVAFGIAEYLGGIAGLYLLEQWFAARGDDASALLLRMLAFSIAICIILMAQSWLKQWRGLLQRIAEAALFGGMILASLGLVLA